MKKLFHRKKNSNPSSPEQTPSHHRQPRDVTSDPALRSSLYASTTSAGLPQTGAYPLKGNHSSVALHGRRSGTHSRGQQSISPDAYQTHGQQDGNLPIPQVASASHNTYAPSAFPQPRESTATRRYQREEDIQDRDTLSHDLLTLNIHAPQGQLDGTRDAHQQYKHQVDNVTGSHEPRYHSGYKGAARGSESRSGVRLVGNPEPAQQATVPEFRNDRESSQNGRVSSSDTSEKYGYTHQTGQPIDTEFTNDPRHCDETKMNRKNSIPRKQVANSAGTPNLAHPRLSAPPEPVDHYSSTEGNQLNPTGRYESFQNRPGQDTSQDFARIGHSQSNARGASSGAEDVVERAKTNTYDTEVIENYAPGKSICLRMF